MFRKKKSKESNSGTQSPHEPSTSKYVSACKERLQKKRTSSVSTSADINTFLSMKKFSTSTPTLNHEEPSLNTRRKSSVEWSKVEF